MNMSSKTSHIHNTNFSSSSNSSSSSNFATSSATLNTTEFIWPVLTTDLSLLSSFGYDNSMQMPHVSLASLISASETHDASHPFLAIPISTNSNSNSSSSNGSSSHSSSSNNNIDHSFTHSKTTPLKATTLLPKPPNTNTNSYNNDTLPLILPKGKPTDYNSPSIASPFENSKSSSSSFSPSSFSSSFSSPSFNTPYSVSCGEFSVRESRTASEKRRRLKLNDKFDTLKSLVVPSQLQQSKSTWSKDEILGFAIKRLNYLNSLVKSKGQSVPTNVPCNEEEEEEEKETQPQQSLQTLEENQLEMASFLHSFAPNVSPFSFIHKNSDTTGLKDPECFISVLRSCVQMFHRPENREIIEMAHECTPDVSKRLARLVRVSNPWHEQALQNHKVQIRESESS